MFVDTTYQIVGDPGVKSSILSRGQNVDVILFIIHWLIVSGRFSRFSDELRGTEAQNDGGAPVGDEGIPGLRMMERLGREREHWS